MKPVPKHKLQVISNLEGREIGMTIDQDSLHHIMDVLSNLYSDAEMAVLREYATNGWDSHIAAGYTGPVEVFLPKTLAPYLRIVDHGVGLDEEDIDQVYSKYGLSTKTDTNDQTGMLGLGGKSAFAYSSQFTVIGIKDGVRTTVSVSRDEEGIGTMTVLEKEQTDDPNGVEIMIPANRYADFAAKAKLLFAFWPEGSVVVDGEAPERVKGLQIGQHITLLHGVHDESYVVMGNVPYPIDFDKAEMDFDLDASDYTIVATVPVGAVHFTPSREELNYTKRTKEVLNQLALTFKADLQDAITKEVEAAPDMPEALRVAIKWRNALPRATQEHVFSYKGTDLPSVIKPANDGEVFLVSGGQREKDWYGRPTNVGKHSRFQQIDLTYMENALWVYGFNQTFTPTVKKKLWQYCDENKINHPKHFIACGKKPKTPWIAKSAFIPWEKAKLMVVPRYSKQGGKLISNRIPGSYDVTEVRKGVLRTRDGLPANDIDTRYPLFRVDGGPRRWVKQLDGVLDDYTIVSLTSNRVAKFVRNFPMAQLPADYLNECGRIFWDFLTEDEREMIAISGENTEFADFLPRAGIADPELRRVLRLVDRYNAGGIEHLKAHRDALRYHLPREVDWKSPISHRRYPLFSTRPAYEYDHSHHRQTNNRQQLRRHNLLYINTVYNSQEN